MTSPGKGVKEVTGMPGDANHMDNWIETEGGKWSF
jgi:hypothetical protein